MGDAAGPAAEVRAVPVVAAVPLAEPKAQAAGLAALFRYALVAAAAVAVAVAYQQWDATLLPALELLTAGLEPVEVAAVVAVMIRMPPSFISRLCLD